MAVIDLDEAKDYLGLIESDASYDAIIEMMIASCDRRFRRILRRNIELDEYVRTLDGNGLDFLRLPEYPIISLIEVRIDATRQFGDDTIVALDTLYPKDEAGLVYRLGGLCWPRYKACIRVTWTAGLYPMPDDLKLAANFTVADWWRRHTQLLGGQSQNELLSESLAGGRAETYRPEILEKWGIPANAMAILESYCY